MQLSSVVSMLIAVGGAVPAPLTAQDAFGTWQGRLALPARPLRLVFDIARDNGRVKVVQFSIDQAGFQSPVAADTISAESASARSHSQ